jgi:hypothetical protein
MIDKFPEGPKDKSEINKDQATEALKQQFARIAEDVFRVQLGPDNISDDDYKTISNGRDTLLGFAQELLDRDPDFKGKVELLIRQCNEIMDTYDSIQ